MTVVPLGFGDQQVSVPSHPCLFHDSYAEFRARQRDFLAIALSDPRQGMALFGAPGIPAQLLRDLELDLRRSLADEVRMGRLVLVESDPDPDVYLERFRDNLAGLVSREYATVRAVGRCTWNAPGFPAPEDQLWLESRLDAVIQATPTILLCAYDLTELSAFAIAYGGLETHRQIVVAGRLTDNPSFVEPGRYFSDRLLRLPWLTPK